MKAVVYREYAPDDDYAKILKVEDIDSPKPKPDEVVFTNKASALFVGKAENLTNSTVYPTGVFVSWTQSNDFIQITNVSGLQVGASYRLRIVVFGDEN